MDRVRRNVAVLPLSEQQRINTRINTTLLLRVCAYVEMRERRKMQMSELLTVVLREYAEQNKIP